MRKRKLAISIYIILSIVMTSFVINLEDRFAIKKADAISFPFYINATDDAYITLTLPDTNTGSYHLLQVENTNGGDHSNYERNGLVGFNLSLFPLGVKVNSVYLRLWYHSYEDTNPQGRPLRAYRITQDWNESNVTWNTQPTYHYYYTNTSIVPQSPGQWMEWNVTQDVLAFLNGTISCFGWKVADETYWGKGNIPVTFLSSKEGGHIPHLVIEGEIISPPSETIVESHPLLTYNEIYAGNGFTLFIYVDPAEAIAGVQFDLSFDPSLFQAGSIHEGSLFFGSTTYFNPGIIDNINGTITDVYVVITTPGDNVTHSGEAVYINFTAPLDVNGTSWFNLSNVVVGSPDGSSVPVTTINASVIVLPNEPWDVNNDDSVNILDLILIAQHWGETGSPCWVPADVNCDGVINILDMVLVGQHWTG